MTLSKRRTKRYGWRPGLPDHRDLQYTPKIKAASALPSQMDLRPGCPTVYDQGNLGSCTANAIGALAEFLFLKENLPDFMPSRLFIYYNERVIEDTVDQDAGAQIRDGMKVVNQLGVPHETLWTYNVKKFAVKPNKSVFNDAAKHKVGQYSTVDNTNLGIMQQCLADGFPLVGGFTVYESFESDAVAKTGVVPMPKQTEQAIGGHAIMVVGYNNKRKWFVVRNSWGPKWGDKGYFYIPYSYFTNPNLADDFWTARMVS